MEKEIAPSDKLRKWFDHDPDKFDDFAKKYRKELEDKKEDLEAIRKKAEEKTVALLYGGMIIITIRPWCCRKF